MKTVKYPIKEMNIKAIPGNKILNIGKSYQKEALSKKTIEAYGLLTPIVAAERPNGSVIVLKGNNELRALKGMAVDNADVFLTKVAEEDIGKIILLLSGLQEQIHHVSEGLILKEIADAGKYNQKQLAAQLGKSESWLSKRLALAEGLDKGVADMVMGGEFPPSSAQAVARLPKEVQHEFAVNARLNGTTKRQVEKLVGAYLKNETSALCETIIRNPAVACAMIADEIGEGVPKATAGPQRFEGALRLLLKVIGELECILADPESGTVKKFVALIAAVKSKAEALAELLGRISPGKSGCEKEKEVLGNG